MEKWLLVVISWGIVLPILAFWASDVVVSGDDHRRTTLGRKARRTSRRPRRTIRARVRRSQSMGVSFPKLSRSVGGTPSALAMR